MTTITGKIAWDVAGPEEDQAVADSALEMLKQEFGREGTDFMVDIDVDGITFSFETSLDTRTADARMMDTRPVTSGGFYGTYTVEVDDWKIV